MLLLIDNYDSFSYNLVQLLGTIYDGEIKVIRNDEVPVEKIGEMAPERIIISPGPGKPSEAGICEEVIKTYAGRIPIFGVCLGHQAICETFGGTIGYAKKLMHGKSSVISVDTSSVLYKGIEGTGEKFFNEITSGEKDINDKPFEEKKQDGKAAGEKGFDGKLVAGRYHSLALEQGTLPECLKVTGIADDGEVMSVEHKDYPVYGVQYHPESILTPEGMRILKNFLGNT